MDSQSGSKGASAGKIAAEELPKAKAKAEASDAANESPPIQQTAPRPTSPRLLRSATTPVLSSTQSKSSSSPLASREGSPVRVFRTAGQGAATANIARSRKNSTDGNSPQTQAQPLPKPQAGSTPASETQSTSSGSSARSSSSTAVQSHSPDAQRTQGRQNTASSSQDRLRSPPSTTRMTASSQKRVEQPKTASGSSASTTLGKTPVAQGAQGEDEASKSEGARALGRPQKAGSSALETVQEDEAGPEQAESRTVTRSPSAWPSTIQEEPDEDNPDLLSSQTTSGSKSSKVTGESGSGSEENGSRKDQDAKADPESPLESQRSAPSSVAVSRKTSTTQLVPPKPAALQPRRSFQHLGTARSKVQSEGSVKGMTVETETVANPDLFADDREGRGAGGRLDGSGSVRAKVSAETIRPKKDKRKARKPANIASGTVSSKADIFEAKVASAVDEAANSSDSEETFVYDSNPPEARSSHRAQPGPRYHHSRTPSAASVKSQTAERGNRGQHFGIAGKKSMKFTNAQQLRDTEDDEGTSTYSSNTARSSHRHHHHVARLERLQNTSQDSDSAVPSTLKTPRVRQPHNWRGHASRLPPDQDQLLSTSLADKGNASNLYDLSGAAEADDEFTPLLSTLGRPGGHDPRRRAHKLLRNPRHRRTPAAIFLRSLKYFCTILLVVALLGIVITAVVLCNRTLQEVKVERILNVLASEQELFLELEVHARNPNLVDISIVDGDLDLFAKSKYVGTTEMWRDGTIPGIDKPEAGDGGINNATRMSITGGVDHGTDPIEEPGSGTHTMLLGRVRDLDNALIFEASPFGHAIRNATAGLRLEKPGNKTEEGGSRRWENVMQHPFELVVRGTLTYLLPLSSREHNVTVSASTTVKPDNPADDDGRGNSSHSGNVVKRPTGGRHGGDVGIEILRRRQWTRQS